MVVTAPGNTEASPPRPTPKSSSIDRFKFVEGLRNKMVVTAPGNTKASPPRPTPKASSIERFKWVYGGGASAAEEEEVRKANNIDSYEGYGIRRIREAEKAEKLIHLICWGPK